jgi:hypothetical protein
LHITGFPEGSAWADGHYELFRELSVSSIAQCAYCPLYVGPESGGKRAFLVSLRPIAGIASSSTAIWSWTVLDANKTVDENFRMIIQVISSIGTSLSDRVKLIQNPLIQASIGVVLADGDEISRVWDLTDVNSSAASVFLLSTFPKIVNGIILTSLYVDC